MIRIACIECGTETEVTPGRGRVRYSCGGPCRVKIFRKSKIPRHAKLYEEKRNAIDRQYKEARRTSVTPNALRGKAMFTLHGNDWAIGNIAQLFGVTEQRVRAVIGKEVKANG